MPQSSPDDGRTLFVGLGRMGEPMARRYATAHAADGHPPAPLLLHDLDPDRATRIAAEVGAEALATLDELPGDVRTVILMLPDSRVVERVLGDGTGGLLGRLAPAALLVDMGSSEPESTRRLSALAEESGVEYVDAPVSGGVAKAESGELAVMVGGTAGAVARAEPHLRPFAATLVHVGPSGAGHAAKALNNLLSATQLAAAAEVLCAAQRAGIDPADMVEVLNASTGRSQATEVKYPRHVLTGSFASGFELDLMLKDLRIALTLAAGHGLEMPVTSSTLSTVEDARETLGGPGHDHTEIVRHYERLNGSLIRTGAGAPPRRGHA
jgi:3-hydroxyisobutyrate dehydrogenase